MAMRTATSKFTSLDELTLWESDKRLLPYHLRTSDNSARIEYYKKALRLGMKTRLTDTQREQLSLFYKNRLTKTEIGKRYGVGSSTICKSLKASENTLREFVELYMQIYDSLLKEDLHEDDEYGDITGG